MNAINLKTSPVNGLFLETVKPQFDELVAWLDANNVPQDRRDELGITLEEFADEVRLSLPERFVLTNEKPVIVSTS